MTHIAESLCNNGGCTRQVYRGKECFRCWAGTKWTSMVQRIKMFYSFPLGHSGRRSSYCKPCNRTYQRAWEEKRVASR